MLKEYIASIRLYLEKFRYSVKNTAEELTRQNTHAVMNVRVLTYQFEFVEPYVRCGHATERRSMYLKHARKN